MNRLHDDLELLGRKLAEILGARPEILEAYLFGSVARSRAHAHSDIDVAIFVDPEVAPTGGFGYRAELMSQGEIDPTVVRRNLAAMRQSIESAREGAFE